MYKFRFPKKHNVFLVLSCFFLNIKKKKIKNKSLTWNMAYLIFLFGTHHTEYNLYKIVNLIKWDHIVNWVVVVVFVLTTFYLQFSLQKILQFSFFQLNREMINEDLRLIPLNISPKAPLPSFLMILKRPSRIS